MSALFNLFVRELNARASRRPSIYNRFAAPLKHSLAVLSALGTLLAAEPVLSINLNPRNPVNTRYATGDIRLIGNTLMTCSDPPLTTNSGTGPSCATAQGSTTTANANNLFYNMRFVDIDSDASTFNSSSARLNIPAGSEVLWAGLYWHGISPNASRNQAKFKVPGQGNYTSLTADEVQVQQAVRNGQTIELYQGVKEVTQLVKDVGSGEYTVADVTSSEGQNREAGWALVVVYKNSNEPFRNLSVYDGLTTVFDDNPNPPPVTVPVELTGFRTPSTGPFTAKLGMVVYDGDATILGDRVLLNGRELSIPGSNDLNDSFNSSITSIPASDRSPGFQNQLGVDIDLITDPSLASIIRPTEGTPAETARFEFSADRPQEGYHPGVFTLAIDSPLLEIEKRSLVPSTSRGSEITFRIDVRNRGFINASVDASNVTLTENNLPSGVDIVSVSDPNCQNRFPCTRNLLRAGETWTIDVTVRVPPDYQPNSVENRATVTSAEDPTPRSATATVTLTAAQSGTIGDTVYNDANNNNVQDTGEQGISGVIVRLTRPDGTTVDSSSTGADGRYQFADLQFGDYRVAVTNPPAGFTATQTQPNPITVNAQNPNIVTADFGFTQQAAQSGTIGDTVYNDANNNNVQDAGEQGISGVIVRLTRPDGTTVDSSPTGADGRYQFAELQFGDYRVAVTNPPAGFTATQTQPNPITVNAQNPNIVTADFGFTQQAANTGTISGRLFNTNNNNAGLGGITVQLVDSSGNVIRTEQTDTNGSYSFRDVPLGNNYTVRVPGTVPNQGGNLTTNSPTIGSINLDANNRDRPNVDFPYQAPPPPPPPPPPTEPDLTIQKRAIGPFVVGQEGTYEIIVTNAANAAATTSPITVTDTLPEGLIFVSSSGNGWTCTTSGLRQISCNNSNPLAPGATSTLTITVRSNQAGSGNNVAEVSTPGETNTGNNRAEAPTTINPPPNRPPVANNDNASTNPGVPVNIPVAGNDTDPDNNLNPGSITIVNNPGNGTVTPNPNGTVTYTPNPGFTSGTDTFTYQICDTTNQCATATVTVTVPAAPPRPPVADDKSTPPLPNNSPIQVPPLTGTDPDGTVVSFTITNVPPAAQGTLLLDGQPVQQNQTLTPQQVSQLVFQPNPNFTGTATFNYTVTDNQGLTSLPATVTIPVIAPASQPPVADDKNTPPLPNTNPIPVPQLTGRDPDGTVVSFTITTLPPASQGTLLLGGQPVQQNQTLTPEQVSQLVFQPLPSFTGTATFNYSVTDNQGNPSAPATVTIPVIAPPLIRIGDTVFNDINGDRIQNPGEPGLPNVTVTLTSPGPDGILGNNDDTTRTTTTDTNGNYSFTDLPPNNFRVTVTPPAGFVPTTPASQDVNLTETNNNVDFGLRQNQPPVGNNTTTPPIPSGGEPVRLPLLTATDPDGSITLFIVNTLPPPTQGTLFLGNPATGGTPVTPGQSIPPDQIGNLFFQPNPGFTGNATFTFTATDNQGAVSPPATVTIPVTAPAQPPVANNDVTGTNPGVPVTINPLINDRSPDGTPLNPGSLRIVSNPTNGTVTVNPDGTVTYTPNPGFTTGTDSFVYEICDTRGICDTATVTVSVPAPAQQPPNANDDRASTNPNTPVVINVLDNDTDPNNNLNQTSVTIVSNPTNGTVSVNPVTGQITYTPNPGFTTGTDTFSYQVCDTTGQCDTATVTVTVPVSANNPPVANNDNTSTNPNTPVLINVLENDSDPDNNLNPRTVTIVSNPANGTVRVNPDGTVVYTPNPGFTTGTDTFVYQVCDTTGLCDTATVTVTVPRPVPRPPVATNDSTSTNPGTPVLINVGANDRDPDGNLDPTTVQIINPPTNGTVRVDPATGNVIYTPNPGFTTGTDTFTYRICDTTGLCTEATVTVTVPTVAANPPIANPDAIATNPNTPVTLNILGNDNGNFNPASLRILTQPANGTVVVNPDGTITYIPNPGFTTGTDTFTYQICDTAGNCTEGRVTVTVPLPAPNQAEVQVILSGPTTPVTAGTNVTFTGQVTNNGPGIATGVTLTFPLPEGVTFVSANPSQGTCVLSNGVVTCDLGNINPGQTVTIPIIVTPTRPGTINGTVTIGAPNDAIVNNNTAAVTAQFIAGQPRVLLVKRITSIISNGTTTNFTNFVDDPTTPNDNAPGWSQQRPVGEIVPSTSLRSGDIVEYTIYFLSDGSTPAQNVNFCDAIPNDTTFIADGFGSRTGIQLNQAGTNSSLTNAQDGDAGAFFSQMSPLPNGNACAEQTNRNGSVILNLRQIPNNPGSNFGFIRFRVTID